MAEIFDAITEGNISVLQTLFSQPENVNMQADVC